jgi:PAS domain S-box-containing protein
VAESTGNAVLIVERDGRLAWANAAARALTGSLSPTQPGQPALDVLEPEDTVRTEWPRLLELLAAGNAVRRTLACRHRNGQRLWIDADMQPRWGENGAIDGYLLVATDITEITNQRERVHALLAALPAGVLELDAAATWRANPSPAPAGAG